VAACLPRAGGGDAGRSHHARCDASRGAQIRRDYHASDKGRRPDPADGRGCVDGGGGARLCPIRCREDRGGGTWRAGGLMLQRVPPEGGYGVIADDVEDGWRRAMVLMSSATAEELVDPD